MSKIEFSEQLLDGLKDKVIVVTGTLVKTAIRVLTD